MKNLENMNKNNKNSNQNINSNQRDYDKEPLIIKDYVTGEYAVYSMFIVFPLLFLTLIFTTHTGAQEIEFYIRVFIILIPLSLFYLYKNKQTDKENKWFEFTNNSITLLSDKKIIKKLNISDISSIKMSSDIRWDRSQNIDKLNFAFVAIWLFAGFSAGELEKGLIFVIGFILVIVSIKFILHIHKGGFNSLRFFDQFVIYENDFKGGRIMNILIATEQEYKTIRAYCIQILQKDINKIPRTFSVFKKDKNEL